MRHTWGEVHRYAARSGIDADELPSPAELAQDDRDSERFREQWEPSKQQEADRG